MKWSKLSARTVAVPGAVAAVLLAMLATPAPASAAATDVVISELMFHAASDLDNDDFLELTNTGSTPVDLSGWSFGGITLVFPAGTTIAGGARLVVGRDSAQVRATYGVTPAAIYSGNLSNSGETITLRDAAGAVIDTVSYLDVAPWPVTPDGLGPSLELIDPSLDNNDPLNWAASTAAAGHTAGAANSVARTGLPPRISNVSASPATPTAGQAVTVTATVANNTGAPTLRFRADFGAEQTLTMQGTGGTYTATMPGVAAGHLLRYRVQATNGNGSNLFPRVDDTIVYQGVVATSTVSSALPILQWFIADTDYSAITNNPTADIERPAALAYNGVVYDNLTVNIRGQGSQTAPKPNWKFEMPHNHDLPLAGLADPVDEFALQADWSDRSHGRAKLAWNAYQQAGVINMQMFPVRVQRNAAFQGVYNYMDLFDGTWRDREGYDGWQMFKAETGAFNSTRPIDVRYEKKSPDETDYAPLAAFLSGLAQTGTAQQNYLLAHADLPQMINYAVVTAIIQHTDSSTKNFYLVQDPTTLRWGIIPWDLDHTWGNGDTCCGISSDFVTPAEAGDQQNALMAAILAVPEWRTMYFRRLRTMVNDILATGELEGLYDATYGPGQPDIALDFSSWPYTGTNTYSGARSGLFARIADRRSVFGSDPRVPGNQPAAPSIVINEIQHSPTGGDAAEFVELYNPSTTTAIDLSGWALGGGVDVGIQPGTVILPGGTMTFVADDPTFVSTYGSTAFVGGTFDDGALSPAGTLTLTRADGSTADTVSYGGTGWPTSTDGRSLELRNPSGDNNDPANWALSESANGTPGAANGGSVVASPPGAPTIGTASAGNASATVRWTPPADDGGSEITGYQVRVVNAATQAQVGSLRPASATATSLLVTGLTNGTAYQFQVAAVNAAGAGAMSALSTAVTPTSSATVPGPPVIGTASQGASGGALTAIARWSPPSSNGGSAITGYRVSALRMSSSAADATVLGRTDSRVIGPARRMLEMTLSSGNYRFVVVAVNAIGTGPESARSNNVVPR
jgi:hypothetical protein